VSNTDHEASRFVALSSPLLPLRPKYISQLYILDTPLAYFLSQSELPMLHTYKTTGKIIVVYILIITF